YLKCYTWPYSIFNIILKYISIKKYIYIYTHCMLKCVFITKNMKHIFKKYISNILYVQGRTDHLETRALPEGPGCPWYLFHRLF
ncbi:unnamed protein product, partial [Staurois parvus]